MPSKKRANRNDQALLGHHGVQTEAQTAEVHDQSIAPGRAIQKARTAPGLLTSPDLLQLQRTVGNRAVSKLLPSSRSPHQRSAGSVAQSRPVIQRAYYYWDYASQSFLYSYGVAAMTPGIRKYLNPAGQNMPYKDHQQTWITEADWQRVQDDRVLTNYFQRGQLPSQDIPAELTNGIVDLDTNDAKAQQLFQNVNNFRFNYTGRFVAPRAAMYAHQGDCRTLVGIYETVAEALGIPVEIDAREHQPQLVAPQPIHGRDGQSNTEDGTAWYFDEHFWAIGAGTTYDLLFMTTTLPTATLSTGTAVRNGVTYYRFSDGRCFIKGVEKALKVKLKGEGRIFNNETAVTAFIDANTDE